MSRTTYEAAWRLLEMIGNNRGPLLSRAAAEFRACLLREQEPEESRPPAENPYIQVTNPNFGAIATSSALFERSTPI
jgi:hypothetical protein